MRNKIIGGMLPLQKNTIQASGKLLLANARCAFFILANHFRPPTIWMPDFYCPSILESFSSTVKFYKKCPDPNNGDLVIFIYYFGWPCNQYYIDKTRDAGALTVVDMSQAFFTKQPNADFIIYSPRKFLPMPDGGILEGNLTCNLESQPINWWCQSALAMEYRRQHEYDNHAWYKMFKNAKMNSPIGYYSMSEYSKNILTAFDTKIVAQKHRENFAELIKHLQHICLYDHLPNDIVPLGFPVLLQNRDVVRQELFNNNIFPPIHWECKHEISKYIMTLPCDYRYDINDMHIIIDTLSQKLKVHRSSSHTNLALAVQ